MGGRRICGSITPGFEFSLVFARSYRDSKGKRRGVAFELLLFCESAGKNKSADEGGIAAGF